MEQKVVFAGPAGAGKTTAISAISDIEVVKTEAKSSDGAELGKHHTTMAMDYGALHLDDGSWVNLYGVPRQERFSFMWDARSRKDIQSLLMGLLTTLEPGARRI